MPTDLRDRTVARLDSRLARAQREHRLPSVVAALVRDGSRVWWGAAGEVDASPPSDDTQYRIGSITKSLIAVCVLRLRDEGRLDIDDPVDTRLADAPPRTSIAQLLSHSGGLRAETEPPWWERTAGGDWGQLTASLGSAWHRHGPGRRFHYSNVGYAILGQLVAEVRGAPWSEVVRDEVLRPLQMTRTSPRPEAPHASGFAVHPWADLVLTEPEHDAGVMAPAGQLWASTADLARWAAFVGGDTGEVLRSDTLDEMQTPRVVDDVPGEPWTTAYGFGFQIWNVEGRRFVGHGGSMPGFLAVVRVERDTGDGVVIATNTTTGLEPTLAPDLLAILREEEPRDEPAWTPTGVPDEVCALTGVWYWGPRPYVLRAHGTDELALDPLDGGGRASRFARTDHGWVGRDAYYAGEPLRVGRDEAGEVTHLDLASFVFTRAPYSPDTPIPGGLDDDGWGTG